MKKQVRLINTKLDKWVERPYGFSLWHLIMNVRFWFVSYFATGNYFMGLLGAGLVAGVLWFVVTGSDDANAQAAGAALALVYVVIGLFSAGGSDGRVARSLLRKGWVFAEPESEAALKAKRSWRV